MTAITDTRELGAALTAWATGYRPLMGAVKLLVDSGMLRKVEHLVDQSTPGRPWLDFEAAARWFDDDGGYLSSGEARIIAIALSLAEARPVYLGDAMASLDTTNARHVLAAVAHTASMRLAGP